MQKERAIWADLLRILAICAVAAVHVCAGNMNLNVHSYEWKISAGYGSLVRWCVPAILMISGMFFLDPEKEITTKKLFGKYIFRIVTAYFFWSAIYVLFPIFKNAILGDAEIDLHASVSNFFLGHYHLQFLHYLLALYLLVPFLRAITTLSTQRMLEGYLLLWFLFTMLPSVLNQFVDIGILKTIMHNMNITAFTGWNIGYFIAGYYFKKYVPTKKMEIGIYLLGIASAAFTCLGTVYISRAKDSSFRVLWGYSTPNIMLITFALFVLFQKQVSKIRFSNQASEWIYRISKYSFGAYLVHDFFIRMFRASPFNAQTINPLFSIPLMTLAVFICSTVFSAILSRIPKLSRYIL